MIFFSPRRHRKDEPTHPRIWWEEHGAVDVLMFHLASHGYHDRKGNSGQPDMTNMTRSKQSEPGLVPVRGSVLFLHLKATDLIHRVGPSPLGNTEGLRALWQAALDFRRPPPPNHSTILLIYSQTPQPSPPSPSPAVPRTPPAPHSTARRGRRRGGACSTAGRASGHHHSRRSRQTAM